MVDGVFNLIKAIGLTTSAKLPIKSTSQSTGYDIFSDQDIVLQVGDVKAVGTGLKFDMSMMRPEIDVQIRSRSGMALNNQVFVLNSPGTIDRDYQGEVKVILMNFGDQAFTINKGDRIAQMVFGLKTDVLIVNSDRSMGKATERGEGGFGSTGVK